MRTLLLTLLLFSPAARAAHDLWIGLGEVRSLPAPADATLRIGQKGLIRTVDLNDQIKVVGLKAGVTTLAIGDRSYIVHVSPSGQKRFQAELQRELSSMKGLRLESDRENLEITGVLLRFRDWKTIADLARHSQGRYSFKAQVLADVGREAMSYFQNLARKNGYPVLRFAADPTFKIYLAADAAGLKRAARETFSPFGIEIHSDDSGVALRPLVRTHVVLAEVSRSFSRDLGVKWPTEYQAQVLPQVNTDAKVMLALQALEARGQAQVLASPNLLCRSGSEARFHAGGEFPIRLASRFTQGVEWKKHGVLLNVRPQADFHGNISLVVETEISLLDAAHSVDKIPALKTNTVKSHFDLPGKRTIALSGLIRQDLSDSGEGLPFLSSLPVLGRLFGSANFQKHLSELVIFVTPEIYVPESDEPIKMPEGWVRDEF